MPSRIDELAQQLMRDQYFDNEPDARLAAVHIILAAERHGHAEPQSVVEDLAELD